MEETFNHDKAAAADKIAWIGEAEHAMRHCLRSAAVLATEENKEEAFAFLVWAKQLKDMRRKYMAKWFGDVSPKSWCLCKSAACLRQLSYEIGGDDSEFITEVDNLVDQMWGGAINMDLSDCSNCLEDKKSVSEGA